LANAWIVRTSSEDFDTLMFDRGVIAVGWGTAGDLSECRTFELIRERLASPYPAIDPEMTESLVFQLYAFTLRIQPGDFVITPRTAITGIAIAQVTGPYLYRGDLAPDGLHTRAATWLRDNVARRAIGPDLLDTPSQLAVSVIKAPDAVERIRYLVRHDEDKALSDIAADLDSPGAHVEGKPSPFDNFRRNLDYARSLADAGRRFGELRIGLFEIDDVFRAAWVQAVAALDHWVRQEVHSRMLEMTKQWQSRRPSGFSRFPVPMDVLENVYRRGVPLHRALDEHLAAVLGRNTYQRPDAIKEGFALVCDTSRWWERVAQALDESGGSGRQVTAGEIKQRLDAIVERRNKIAHEYDEDPNTHTKRAIDAASVTANIDWIERLAAALRDLVERDSALGAIGTGTDG
jgi:hypothetical protein